MVFLLAVTWTVARRGGPPAATATAGAQGGPAVEAPVPSVAVLPFTDLSPSKDQQHFGEGLAEEIMNALAQTEGLKVAGRLSSFRFRDQAGDLQAIQRQLGVGAVLQGSVRVDGSHVRVAAQLIKTADGYTLWSQTFERELTGVFAVQDEIAAAVVEALKVRLLGGRSRTSRELRTASPEAYSQFLLGRAKGIKRHNNSEPPRPGEGRSFQGDYCDKRWQKPQCHEGAQSSRFCDAAHKYPL